MSIAVATTSDLAPLWKIVGQLLEAGRWHDAEVTLRSAAETTGSLPIRITLGTLLAERGDLRAAIDEWTVALTDATETADFDSLAAVYHNLAAVYREQGDCGLASRLQQQSLNYLCDGEANDFLQLANDAIYLQNWSLAERLLAAAAELDQAAAEDQTTADQASADPTTESLTVEIAATQGLLAGFRGAPERGWRALVEACRVHERCGAIRLAAKDLVNLAALLAQMGRQRLASRCLQRAQRHAACVEDAILSERIARLLARTEREGKLAQFRAEWN